MFDLSGFWALFKLNYFCLLFQNLFVVRKLSLNCLLMMPTVMEPNK